MRADTPEQFSPAHMRERVLGGMHRTQFARSPAKHFRRDLRSADACIRFGPSSNQAVSGDPLKPVHKSFVESGLRLAGYSQRMGASSMKTAAEFSPTLREPSPSDKPSVVPNRW